MASTPGSIRYEQPPVLQSVCAYGSETLVPNNDLCRLSYYLKCCAVGCGINIGIDDALLDYMNAHHLSIAQQEQILRYSFSDLSLVNLMNRAFILDDQHILLPQGTLNTFFEFKTASTFFSINSFTVSTGQQVYVHKVMLFTLKWMREYYIDPFLRYQQGNPLLEVHATPVAEEDEISYAVGGDDYIHQGMVVTPILDHHHSGILLRRTCCSCLGTIQLNRKPCYRCTQCTVAEFCEDCYTAGRHDQTHTFERLCRTSSEYLCARVETLHEGDSSFLPDVPMAIALPVQQLKPAPTLALEDMEIEPVARAIDGCSRKKRRRSSSLSSFGGASENHSRHERHPKTLARKKRSSSDTDRRGVASSSISKAVDSE